MKMKKYLKIFILLIWSTTVTQECPPADTLSIDPLQDLWSIPSYNQWNEAEIMTWNIKNFPINNNTINYVNEIILDVQPDIIAFQEINNETAFNTLANDIQSYEFISSGSGLALAVRSDIINIISWTTLFPSSGYEFAWRFPLLVELNWVCGINAMALHIINIHLKSGSSNEDFNRRYDSAEMLSDYVNDHPNKNFIILGDYNDEISDSENNNSLWPMIENEQIIFATESIANIDYYASFPSWPSFIDHIALSYNLYDEFINGNINTLRIDDYTGYNFYQNNISDHRPIILSFPIEMVELNTNLVINEIMANPLASADASGEWIEITNISETEINLNGLIIKDNDSDQHIISDHDLIIQPNGFLTLGINDDMAVNGNVIIDYVYNNFTLSNLWDEVILMHPSGIIIDEVYYDNGITFPDESGKSMMLINSTFDNSMGENWSISSNQFGSGDFGTPQEENFPEDCQENNGDMNEDGGWNVLDIVALANCVLAANCDTIGCNGDLNNDGGWNVLDIVALANCVLAANCN